MSGFTRSFLIANGVDDAYTNVAAVSYPPVASVGYTDNQGFDPVVRDIDAGSYRIWNALYRWDTSSIPDNTVIDSAVLRVQVSLRANTDGLTLSGDWGPLSMSSSDWRSDPLTNAFSGWDYTVPTLFQDVDITLSNVDANISRLGYTYIRTHLSQLASNAAPTGNNYCSFTSTTDTGGVAARLVVSYSYLGDGPGAGYIAVGP